MGTVSVPLDILGARVDLTNTPELYVTAGSNFPSDGYAFPQSSSRALYVKIGAEAYGNSGSWTLSLRWYSRSSSTSGNVTWTVAMAAITPGDAQSVETKAFATSQAVTQAVVATAKADTESVLTISNLDSVAAGDDVWFKITRTDTSMTGDAILFRGSLSYSDGASATNPGTNVVLTSAFTTTGTSLQDITGTSIAIPSAGTWIVRFTLAIAQSATTNNLQCSITATAGTIGAYMLTSYMPMSSTSNNYEIVTTNGTATAAVSRTTTSSLPSSLVACFTTTTSGTVVARIQTNGGTATVAIGSSGSLSKV